VSSRVPKADDFRNPVHQEAIPQEPVAVFWDAFEPRLQRGVRLDVERFQGVKALFKHLAIVDMPTRGPRRGWENEAHDARSVTPHGREFPERSILRVMRLTPDIERFRLIRWSEFQAGIMFLVILLALLRVPPAVIAIAPVLTFGALIAWCHRAWTPRGGFGAANATTLLRLLIILGLILLPGLGSGLQFALALSALALDGLDGWLARMLGLSSEFGEYFDKEVDSIFTLILGMMLFREGLLGAWILIPGGMRYAFVLFIKFVRPPKVKETGTTMGKIVCVMVVSALMICLLPVSRVRAPLAITATLVLFGSFVYSWRQMYGLR
jgi:phosphatidylglycerophosphate synthase